MSYQPIILIVNRRHWPLAGYASHAVPAMGQDQVAVQYMATTRDERALRGLCAAVFPSTSDGLRGAKKRFPSIPWETLGVFFGCEISNEVDA